MRARIDTLILNKWVIAGVLSILLFLILPTDTTPWKVSFEIHGTLDRRFFSEVMDLNHDGNDEVILFGFFPDAEMLTIITQKNNGYTLNQTNLYGFTPLGKGFGLIAGDIDNNGTDELIVPYYSNHEIGVYVESPMDTLSAFHQRFFVIDSLENSSFERRSLPVPDFRLVNFSDTDTPQVLLILYGSYHLYTYRKLVLVDLETGKVKESRQFCNIFSSLDFFDFDGDGAVEITGYMGAPDNSKPKDSCTYPDNYAHFMVFNQELELINQPSSFKGNQTLFTPLLSDIGEQKRQKYLVQYANSDNKILHFGEIESMDSLKPPDKVLELDYAYGKWMYPFKNNKETYFLSFSNWGNYLLMNRDFEIINQVNSGAQYTTVHLIDFNQDHAVDIALFDKESASLTYRDLNNRVMARHTFQTGSEVSLRAHSGIRINGTERLYVQTDSKIYYGDASANGFHYVKWLMLLGFSGFFLLVFALINWIQRRQIAERESLINQVKQVQLQSIKNQLDPHFTFNALNVLSFLANEDDKEGLKSFVHHFSKLLRRQVETSDKPYITLFDEIRFVEHYIELQRLRFDLPIDYDVDVAGAVDINTRIPKMMIHTHVENAIKHGLIPAGGGSILVRITKPNRFTQIEIENNGTARSAANTMTNGSTGKGLLILDQLYDLFFQLYKTRIKQEIIDLQTSAGEPSGTLIRIRIY